MAYYPKGSSFRDWRRGNTKKRKRSGKWRSVRKEHLKRNPRCAVCSSKKSLEVHHIVPFHVNHELELKPFNLITLCDGLWGLNCHFVFGHLRNWRRANDLVVSDSARWNNKLVVKDD